MKDELWVVSPQIISLKSTAQADFSNLDNRKMATQIISHFLNCVKHFSIENINWLAIWNSDNQNSMIFRGWEIQNVGEPHIARDNQSVFPLGITENLRIALSAQADIAYIHSVKTASRRTRAVERGTSSSVMKRRLMP